MRYGKITVFLFTLLFAAAALALWALEPGMETMPLALTLTSAGEEKTVNCWKNEAGEYFLFLPSYAEPASAQFQVYGDDVRIDGREIKTGMFCEALALDTPYSFSFLSEAGMVETVLTVNRSKNLPTLYIDTGSGSMDHIHGKKGNQETGRMCLVTPDGALAYTGELDRINGRGNDWLIPKKSYSLQLSAGTDLLGMGLAEKWILQSNAFDGSHLRNKLAYDFAGVLGLEYSPESRWVDLYLNGEYAGMYLLCERNELHEQRVSLEGTGAYLVSMDVGWRLEQNNKPFLKTESGLAFRIHDSMLGDAELRQQLQSVENAVCAEDGMDPLTGKHWTELIDLDSWVRKYLVEEIFGNSDGGAISQYFYGSGQGMTMYAGPVWDFDVSMGNSQVSRVREPEVIFAGSSQIWSHIDLSWYYELCQRELFRESLAEVYREDCLPLLDVFLNGWMEESVSQIERAAEMNQLRWGDLGAYQTGAREEAENIRSYMESRIGFLNQLWLEQEPFYRVLVDAGDGSFVTCYAVRPGEQLPDLPEYEPSSDILGWYVDGTDMPFEITQPILEDMTIVLRRVGPENADGEAADTGSAIQYAPFALLLGTLMAVCLLDRKRWSRMTDA